MAIIDNNLHVTFNLLQYINDPDMDATLGQLRYNIACGSDLNSLCNFNMFLYESFRSSVILDKLHRKSRVIDNTHGLNIFRRSMSDIRLELVKIRRALALWMADKKDRINNMDELIDDMIEFIDANLLAID